MKKEIEIKCPAKINLTLDVINRRTDGYHNLSMIMQEINLFDILKITVELDTSESIIRFETESEKIPADENNLVTKAAKLFAIKAIHIGI